MFFLSLKSAISQIALTPMRGAISSTQPGTMFSGGSGNGSSIQSVAQTSCLPLNLIRYYDPGNSSSYAGTGTALNDLSGFSVNGTLVNGVSYNSSNGGALVFDGSNDYVSFSSGLPNTDNLTYEAWVNPSDLSSFRAILMHDSWTTSSTHFEFHENRLQYAIFGQQDKYATYTFSINTWYHVVAVYSKSLETVSFYINGSLTNTETYSNPPTTSNTSIKLGAWNGTSRFFNGKIGLIRIYSKTLSSTEVLSNYNESRARFGL